MSEIMEIFMLICFGLSWPANVIKSYSARTTKGKSLLFLLLIIVGYVFGIASKLTAVSYTGYVLFFYVLNLLMVCADLALYIRNSIIDKRSSLGPSL